MVKITIIIDSQDYIKEIEYLSRLFSSLLDAVFTICSLDSISETYDICIAYCQAKNFGKLPESCKIKLIPDDNFWAQYLLKKCPDVNVQYFENLYYLSSADVQLKVDYDSSGITSNIDIFSSSFFLISRIEEVYGEEELDQHNRYKFSSSIIGDEVIDWPLINMYACKLSEWVEKYYHIHIPLKEKNMSALITHDIDRPFARGNLRSELSNIYENMKKNGKYEASIDLISYFLSILKIKNDPFDVFDYLCETEQRRNIKATFFALTDIWGLKKKNYTKQLIKLRTFGNEIALHPGYYSLLDSERLLNEKKLLESLSGVVPAGIRNHFLKFEINESYKFSENLGFFYDSTLGYAEREGFRAGTCTPFKPFDIESHRIVELIEFPLVIMDCTLINYRNFSPEEAFDKIKNLINVVHQVNGTIVINWHNHLLFDSHVEWRKLFEKTLDYLLAKNAVFDTCTDLAKRCSKYWDG